MRARSVKHATLCLVESESDRTKTSVNAVLRLDRTIVNRDVRTRTLPNVPSAIHISGIRVGHVQAPERDVRINRPIAPTGPITWGRVERVAGVKVREGSGRSGLIYRVRQSRGWRVMVVGTRGHEVEAGSARMQDHALALAAMWEQAVLSGRIDMS